MLCQFTVKNFKSMFYMEHADCTGCKMQEGDEI